METPTADQLRNRIDSGLTGEKVAMSDPAAAPLGTDAEAGGAAPTAPELALAVRQPPETVAGPVRSNGFVIYLLLAGLVAVILVLVVMLAVS